MSSQRPRNNIRIIKTKFYSYERPTLQTDKGMIEIQSCGAGLATPEIGHTEAKPLPQGPQSYESGSATPEIGQVMAEPSPHQ